MKFKLGSKIPKISEYPAKVSDFFGEVYEYFTKMVRLLVKWFNKFEKVLFTRVLRVTCTVLLPVILLTSFFVFDGEDYWEFVFLVWVLSIPTYFVLFLLSKIVDGKSLVIKLSMSDFAPDSVSFNERKVFKGEQSDELSDDWETPEPIDETETTVSRFHGREYKELADVWGLDAENDREAIRKHLDKVLLMGEESVNKHARDIRDFLLSMAREEKRHYGKTYTFYKGLYDISDDRSLIILVRRLLYELKV